MASLVSPRKSAGDEARTKPAGQVLPTSNASISCQDCKDTFCRLCSALEQRCKGDNRSILAQKLIQRLDSTILSHEPETIHSVSLQSASYLLKVPPEIRRMLYLYLIPNMPVRSESRSQAFNHELRHDGERCSTELLRVNRKIYREMVCLWYSSTEYHISIWDRIRFGSQDLVSMSQLPFSFRHIATLSISVQLQHYSPAHAGRWCKVEHYEPQRGSIHNITHYFSASGPGNLRRFHLSITPGPYYFANMCDRLLRDDWKTTVRQHLEYNLHPFRQIRVSGSASVEMPLEALLLGHPGFMVVAYQQRDEQLKAGVATTAREYFDLLEKDMFGSSS